MGKILLSGFKLEAAEKTIADNMLKNYQAKLERVSFDYLKLDLRQKPHSKHGKETLYELNGLLFAGKKFSSRAEGLNLFLIIAEVLDNLLQEAEHVRRTKRQRR